MALMRVTPKGSSELQRSAVSLHELQLSGLQLPCSSISLHFRCIMAAPAASALWVTAALAASSRFISDVLWLLLQLQPSGLQLPCSFSSLHFRCIMATASTLWITTVLAASSRCISDVLWLLLQPQLSRLQLRLQLHLASFPMYYGSSCNLSSLGYSCACGFISLRFRCIMAAPAASVPWNTAALQLQLSGLQLPSQLHLASFPMYYGCSCSFSYLDYSCFCSLSPLDYSCPCSFISLHFRCIMAAPAASALWITAALAASSRFITDVLWLLLQLQLSGLQLFCSFSS